jgi:hypothetical protein
VAFGYSLKHEESIAENGCEASRHLNDVLVINDNHL